MTSYETREQSDYCPYVFMTVMANNKIDEQTEVNISRVQESLYVATLFLQQQTKRLKSSSKANV